MFMLYAGEYWSSYASSTVVRVNLSIFCIHDSNTERYITEIYPQTVNYNKTKLQNKSNRTN